jgi:hypothetical protein
VDIPLAFEQTSEAMVALTTDSSSVAASIEGTDLTAAMLGPGTLSATLANPGDGNLHVVNSGAVDEQVSVSVMIRTIRTLTITAPSHDYAHGASVSFDVVLTEAGPDEVASAQLCDQTGSCSSISLSLAGDGHWTGQVTPSSSGTNSIVVDVSGAKPRHSSYEVAIATGTVSIAPGFSERLVDSDGDGLANQLVLTPTVTAQSAGTYSVVAYLLDSSGTEIDVTGGDVQLIAGSQPLDLAFDGATIYASGKSGPYRLAKVAILSDGGVTEASVADMGLTQAYDYKVFGES